MSTLLVSNALFSLVVLPLFLPPFRLYALSELAFTFLWCCLGLVMSPVYPVVVVCLSILLYFLQGVSQMHAGLTFSLLWTLLSFCLVRVLFFKPIKLEIVLAHALTVIMIGGTWFSVLNKLDGFGG